VSEIDSFAQIAPYLTHPLVLAGFVLLLFFGLLRAFLTSEKLPTVSQSAGGKALLLLLRYGFLIALAVIVLGFALAFYQAQRTTVDADEIIRDFEAATKAAAASQSTLDAIARLEELQDGNAFQAAVVAIIRESRNPDASRGIDRAIELLRQGETGAAESALTEILDRRLQERATASADAAEAARNLGAIAYLNDTAKAIEAFRTATELDPEDASSWIFLGRLYLQAGNLSSAEIALEEAREASDRTGNERNQGLAQLRIGDVRMLQGDLSGALDAYSKSRAIAEKLVVQDPSSAEWQRDLSVSYEKIGDAQSARGDLDSALKAYLDSLAVAEKLAAQDPGNAAWQRDLSVSFERMGDVQSARGHPEAALKMHLDSLAIREDLARQDPSSAEWQYDLSVSFNRIGNVQYARGNLDGALGAYEDSRTIREKLAAQDPSNTDWQRGLSFSFVNIGDVQSARGNLDAALRAYKDGLDIREKLASQDPSNAEWRRDLIVSHWRLADLAEQRREEATARRHWRAALAIATDLRTSGRLAPPDAHFVETIETRLVQLGQGSP
jgi:tetratricopeptide (TPR) repeat protein